MKFKNLTIPLLLITLFSSSFLQQINAQEKTSLLSKISNDYKNFYSKNRLSKIGVSYLVLGLTANSSIDERIQNSYQENIRSDKTNDASKIAKLFGEGKYLVPISLIASGAYFIDPDSKIGNWGLNTARSYSVGLPVVWAMQNITGGSRPVDNDDNSSWKPFKDNNGVSGHSFVGAVPFLTLAKMNDNKWIKYGSYVASGLAGWSRINDDSHYASQAALGWYMAYESVESVFDTNTEATNFSYIPVIQDDFYGVSFVGKW